MASMRTGLHTEVNFFPHPSKDWVHNYKQQEPNITHHVLQRPLPQLKRPPGSNISGRRHQTSFDLSCSAATEHHNKRRASAANYLSPLPCGSQALAPSQAARTTESPEILMHLSPTALASCPLGKCCLHHSDAARKASMKKNPR